MARSPGDWQIYNNPRIRKQAGRLAALVARKGAPKKKDFFSILDFLLGATYEFVRADLYGFEHVANREPETDKVIERSVELSKGNWRRDGKWMAGLHFNSALVRLSAVHHRSLKLVVGHDEDLYDLRKDAAAFYLKEVKKKWQYSDIAIVHREVNNLKHKKLGTWTGRTVPVATAMRALSQSLDLLEAWASAEL
jgi:hypothetical protein